MVKVKCVECGLEFLESPSRMKRLKGTDIFCSISCRTKNRNEGLNEFQRVILEDIKTNPGFSITDLAQVNQKYRETIDRTIKKLLRLQKIKKIGKRYWTK